VQGNVLVVPIENSLLYVRPIYVQAQSNPVPELKRVVVVYAGRAEMGTTLQEALIKLFGDAPATLEKPPTDAPEAPPPSAPGAGDTAEVRELLEQAQRAYDAAQAALRSGNLAEYQRKVEEMAELLGRAREASGSPRSTTTTTTTSPGSGSA
jgi:uncharacterized membrane protein (UPF0182 family)